MADQQKSLDKARSPSKSKLVRSQKIIQLSPSDMRPQDIPEDSIPPKENALPRSHTPGHLSTKSADKRKASSSSSSKDSRSRSHSAPKSSPTPAPTLVPKLPPLSNGIANIKSSELPYRTSPVTAATTSSETPSTDDQRRPV